MRDSNIRKWTWVILWVVREVELSCVDQTSWSLLWTCDTWINFLVAFEWKSQHWSWSHQFWCWSSPNTRESGNNERNQCVCNVTVWWRRMFIMCFIWLHVYHMPVYMNSHFTVIPSTTSTHMYKRIQVLYTHCRDEMIDRRAIPYQLIHPYLRHVLED